MGLKQDIFGIFLGIWYSQNVTSKTIWNRFGYETWIRVLSVWEEVLAWTGLGDRNPELSLWLYHMVTCDTMDNSPLLFPFPAPPSAISLTIVCVDSNFSGPLSVVLIRVCTAPRQQGCRFVTEAPTHYNSSNMCMHVCQCGYHIAKQDWFWLRHLVVTWLQQQQHEQYSLDWK